MHVIQMEEGLLLEAGWCSAGILRSLGASGKGCGILIFPVESLSSARGSNLHKEWNSLHRRLWSEAMDLGISFFT